MPLLLPLFTSFLLLPSCSDRSQASFSSAAKLSSGNVAAAVEVFLKRAPTTKTRKGNRFELAKTEVVVEKRDEVMSVLKSSIALDSPSLAAHTHHTAAFLS